MRVSPGSALRADEDDAVSSCTAVVFGGRLGLSMALDKAPFSDVRGRQALSMAINRDIVSEVINKGSRLYGSSLGSRLYKPRLFVANLGPTISSTQGGQEAPGAAVSNGLDLELEWAEFRVELRRVRQSSRASITTSACG